MLLAQEIETFKEEDIPSMKPEVLKILFKGVDDLIAGEIQKEALKVGDKMPSFSLPDPGGKMVSSDELLERGSLILSFYRGGWCPYCNLELRALQHLLPDFSAEKATLVAISPEKPDNSLSTQEKNDLGFSVLSDSNNKVARSMGLVFEVPQEVVVISKSEFDLDYMSYNGTSKHELPIPATYVVGSNSIIKYAFVDPDYSRRAEPSEILKVIKEIK